MKIIEEKVSFYPPHAICKADIPVIFALLPAEWTARIKSVRLSSSKTHPMVTAFRPYSGSLTITSRGFSKEKILRTILIELAGHAIGVTFLAWRRLQERDEVRIERIIKPLFDEILPQLSRKKVWLDKKGS